MRVRKTRKKIKIVSSPQNQIKSVVKEKDIYGYFHPVLSAFIVYGIRTIKYYVAFMEYTLLLSIDGGGKHFLCLTLKSKISFYTNFLIEFYSYFRHFPFIHFSNSPPQITFLLWSIDSGSKYFQYLIC